MTTGWITKAQRASTRNLKWAAIAVDAHAEAEEMAAVRWLPSAPCLPPLDLVYPASPSVVLSVPLLPFCPLLTHSSLTSDSLHTLDRLLDNGWRGLCVSFHVGRNGLQRVHRSRRAARRLLVLDFNRQRWQSSARQLGLLRRGLSNRSAPLPCSLSALRRCTRSCSEETPSGRVS